MKRKRINGSAPPDDLTLYQQFIEVAPVSMAILDAQQPALPIIYVNAAFEALTGYARAEVLGKPADLLLGTDQDASAAIRAGLTAQTASIGTIQDARRDGTPYWSEIRLSPRLDARGQVTHFIVALNDVSAYKQDEDSLRQSERRYRSAIEIMPDLMFFHSADGTFRGYHAPSESLLALPPEQFLGKKIDEIFPPEQAKRFEAAIAQAVATRQVVRMEYSLTTPEGIRDFEARYIPNAVDEITSIIRDVTALRQSERQSLNLALEKARTRLLTEFVRNASHEFRTPLSIISSSAYLMVRLDDVEQRRFRLEQIEASIQRITKLVDLLLKMVTLDTNLPDPSPVDVAEALQTLHKKVLLPADAARIRFEPPPNLPTVPGYSDLLIDAVRQIVENALRYTPEDGQIAVRAYSHADNVVIEVSDTGIGIPADALPHIFETFWRQDEAHSTPGLGLGLSIAQKIVELQHGRIEVESAVGQGSTFRLLLPR